MSNQNKSEQNSAHLIPCKLQKCTPNCAEKYHFFKKLLIVEYR